MIITTNLSWKFKIFLILILPRAISRLSSADLLLVRGNTRLLSTAHPELSDLSMSYQNTDQNLAIQDALAHNFTRLLIKV